MNFRKVFTLGSFPVAFFVLSFPGVVSSRSLFDFLLAFLCGAFFRAVSGEGFPCVLLQPLVSCALF